MTSLCHQHIFVSSVHFSLLPLQGTNVLFLLMHHSLQAYNITNDEPIYFWTFLTQLLVSLGYAAPKYHLPYWFVQFIAMLLAWLTAVLRPLVTLRPTFTPMTVALAGTHHYYSCQRAKDDMQYHPEVPLQKAVAETVESFSHLRNDS